uniref:Uncharacterized protein n=1 Tax=Anguilla anguilla TaxID=7936 RepID=A0A0E9RTE1_ANGAN
MCFRSQVRWVPALCATSAFFVFRSTNTAVQEEKAQTV